MSQSQGALGAASSATGADANPWVCGRGAPKPPAAAATHHASRPSASGPLAPQPSVPAPDAVDRLPRRQVRATAGPWWLGVHGGAGESTLARLLPGSAAAGHAWPQPAPTRNGAAAAPLPLLLVARSHWNGLRAAQLAATDWASGEVDGVDLLGLVIIADAPGKRPRPLKELAALVTGAVPRTWHVPWVESWRIGEEVTEATAPKEIRRLLLDIRALISIPPEAPAGPHRER